MKSKKELAFAIITIALVFGLSGCGNKNVQKGGEGTNFPYSWQEKGNGEILVKLDGSSSDASYGWSGASEDDEIVSISEKGSEKKGKVSFILKPVAEGETVVTFIRDKAVEGTEPAAESQGEDPADLITEKPADTEAPDADEGATDEEDSSYVFDSYNERYAAKDIISKISFKISVGTDEKSGKLKATALANVDSELSGIIESESSSFTYTLWEDENNNAVLKIPGTTEYAVNISSSYTPEEREEIPGFVYDEPAKDEEGNYIITEVSMAGFIDGETVYEIRGLAKGSATITFTSPDESKVITVEIEIDEDHKVKVLSHKS